MDLSFTASDRSHPDRPIRNPCSELTYLITIRLLIWFQPHPCETLPDQPDHSCPISTVSLEYFHHSRPGWNAISAKIPKKMVLGSLEHAIPEGFRNLSRFARSSFGGQNKGDRCRSPPPPPHHRSRCGSEGRSPLPDPTSRSPRRSGQANDAPIRWQLR